MSFYVSPNKSSYELAPAGTHPAIFYQLIDRGTHTEQWENKEPKDVRQIQVGWELSIEERMENGKPYTISKRWNHFTGERATIRKDIEFYRGQTFKSKADFQRFDLTKVLGEKCMINIQHSIKGDNERANVVSVSPPMKGVEFKPLYNSPQLLLLERGKFNAELFESLPEWLRTLIGESREYKDLKNPPSDAMAKLAEAKRAMTLEADLDDEIPF
jgi:hypothetical protein